jgi:hypothetical protein
MHSQVELTSLFSGINTCDDHCCNKGTLAQGWGSGTAFFPYLVDARVVALHFL